MSVAYILFTDVPAAQQSALIAALQADPLGGVGATLGVYSVGRTTVAKFDGGAPGPELQRLFAVCPELSIVFRDDPDFANAPDGAGSYGVATWIAPPPMPLVAEDSVSAASALDPTPHLAARQIIETVGAHWALQTIVEAL